MAPFLGVFIPALSACSQSEFPELATEVTFEELMSDTDRYDSTEIMIEGFFCHGFETIVLSE